MGDPAYDLAACSISRYSHSIAPRSQSIRCTGIRVNMAGLRAWVSSHAGLGPALPAAEPPARFEFSRQSLAARA
jgi:hypothetical protein